MKTLLLALLAISPLAVCRQATAQDEPLPQQVRLEVFIARLPEARAIDLLPDLRDAAKCAEAQEQIVALIAKKEAELVDWPVLTTKSGQRAVTTNVHRVRYVAEYSVRNNVPKAGAGGGDAAKAEEAMNPKGGGFAWEFDTKEVGITLEVEPTVQPDGQHVDVQLAPQHTTLLGWNKLTIESGAKDRVTVEQPDFQTFQTSTNITMPSGASMLLGFHKVQDGTQQVEVFILTTTVLKGGRATGKNAAREDGRKQQR